MSTERLYYTNSYLTIFAATVLDVRTANGRTGVILDQSAIYPASGGQPSDTGRIVWEGGEVEISEAVAEDGAVLHLLPQGAIAPPVGIAVRGEVEWPRRFDHMQQHSGQHLLSQVFERLFAMETVSVHIGAEENTVDLSTASLDAAQMEEAERLVNEKVFAALEIRSYFVAPGELGSVPLRRPPKVSGTVRIVEITDYDFSACGGTHCRSTAEVGMVKLLRSEKRKGIVRVTFVCGGRALRDYQRKHTLLGEAAALYSSDIGMVPVLAQRNLAQGKESQRRIEELTARLLVFDAQRLLAGAIAAEGARVVCSLREGLDAPGLRTLATLLIEQPGVVALLGSASEGKLLLTFARSGDLNAHMGNLLRGALQRVGGSGGGRPEFAQGGGVDPAHAEELLAWAQGQWAVL